MKKRILGLALALILIISLLPLTAIAAESPAPRFLMYDPYSSPKSEITESSPVYVVYENVLDTNGTTVLGNKPVIATTVPTDNYIKYEYANGVVTVTLKNINYKRVGDAKHFIKLTNVTGASNAFDVVIKLEGDNKIEATGVDYGANYANIHLEQQGNLTITGTGSLTANVSLKSPLAFIQSINESDLLIKDTSITAVVSQNNESIIAGIAVNGNVTIDNSTVDIRGIAYGYGAGEPTGLETADLVAICTGTGIKTSQIIDKDVTIKNDSKVTLISGKRSCIRSNGKLSIENSTVDLTTYSTGDYPFAYSAPYVTGCNTVEMMKKGDAYKDFASFELTAGTPLTGLEKGFRTVHEHAAIDKDDTCLTAETCACGKEITPAKQHIAGTKNDCTKNTPCGNEGCAQPYAEDALTAHVAGQDDGDCTTDILCSNPGCTQVAVEGAAKHIWDRADCSVAGSCTTPGCSQTVEAGAHSGGTATCKAKAKCEYCGVEYGELGACAPAADDGDCTTAVKCSVCGKETTKAQTDHKYTDKKDTTCDNAGCTNTRKVEGTENPKTGDNTALVLMVSLMATAAAAFVCTKKFAR